MVENISDVSHVTGEHNDRPKTRSLSHRAFLPQDLVLSSNLNKQKPRPPPALMSTLTIKINSYA